MADTFTAVLGMTLPEIGASDDTWGDKLNDNLDILDALFATTGEGTVIVRDASNDALVSGINLTKAAGNARVLKIKSGTSLRWDFGADATAEAGSDAGSIFKINRYDDLGALLGTPFQINRASGLVTFATTPLVGANEMLHQGNLSNIAVPIGTPIPWLLDTLPSGYLWMNGQTVSRTTYAVLFALLGITFGAGNGATTFGLPDWREVVPVGKSTMGGVSARGLITHLTLTNPAAAPVGAGTHTLTRAEIPTGITSVNASQSINATVNTASSRALAAAPVGDHVSYAQVPTGSGVVAPATGLSGQWSGITSLSGATNNSISVTSNNTGGEAHNNVQPSVVCNWAIKATA